MKDLRQLNIFYDFYNQYLFQEIENQKQAGHFCTLAYQELKKENALQTLQQQDTDNMII